jgi:pimeloyl-ACP methyl ester carboxylesterase/DNA-binding CsgD family transcriptional regulator
MQDDVRFCTVDGRRVAYQVTGEGPLLVFGARWITHLEEDWDDPRQRAFYLELARTHRVVRFDRLGCGLSDRSADPKPTAERETRTLAAVLDEFGDEPATIFGLSCASLSVAPYAIANPDRVHSLVFFGAYASRDDMTAAAKTSLVEFVRSNWGIGSTVLASLFYPRASAEALDRLARFQRRSATAEVAANFLALDFETDVRTVLPQLPMPALVLHRRGDRTVPIACGREVASLLPNARFMALRGESHLPWLDDQRDVLRALSGFLTIGDQSEIEDSPLTSRETQVLRLVANGLSNREIAGSLVLSEHTVHRHFANILQKLALSTRAAAAAHAARAGLI